MEVGEGVRYVQAYICVPARSRRMSGRTARQFAGYQDAAQLGDPEFWATIAFTHHQNAIRWAHDAQKALRRGNVLGYQRSVVSAQREQRFAEAAQANAGY